VRDVPTGQVLLSIQGIPFGDGHVAFSPDGTRLAASSSNLNLKIWDTGSWQELFSLDGHRDFVKCLTFSRDNRYLAVGGGKTVYVWNATTGEKAFSLSGQTDTVTSVTFSPDGKRLFSCGLEGSINVWDLPNRVKLLTLHGQGQFVAMSPDGSRLATSPFQSPASVQVWDSELLSREERWKRHLTRIPFWESQNAAAPATKPQPKTNDEISPKKPAGEVTGSL